MWLELQIFGFRALWSPYYLLFIIGIALLYFLITGPYRHKFGGDIKPTTKQQIYLYSALLLLYIAKGSPIDLLSHIMLTAHMTQIAIYLLIFPILVVKGIPVWIWKKVVETPIIRPVINLFTKPLLAMLLFNILFSIYHMPGIFDFSKSSQLTHSSISIVLLLTAFFVWWPVVVPIKEKDTMKPLLKIGYIVANGALITPACALIIFANDPLFASYSSGGAFIQAMSLCVPGGVLDGLTLSGAEMFSPMSTIDDQQLGGVIMQTLIQIIYGVLIAEVFFKWFTKASHKIDPVPAHAVSESP